jgi:hypothetical protein
MWANGVLGVAGVSIAPSVDRSLGDYRWLLLDIEKVGSGTFL